MSLLERASDFLNQGAYEILPLKSKGTTIIAINRHGLSKDTIRFGGKKRLRRVLSASDHLLVEGDRRGVELDRMQTVEGFVVEEFERARGREATFLEEGISGEEVLSRYGIGGLEGFLHKYGCSLARTSLLPGLKPILLESFDIARDDHPSVGDDELEEVIKLPYGDKEMSNKGLDMSDLCELRGVATGFRGRVRDREVINPKIMDFRQSEEGQMSVLIGSNHVEAVVRGVCGLSFPQPLDWDVFVKGQSEHVQRTAQSIKVLAQDIARRSKKKDS